MRDDHATLEQLLLSYVGLLAERNAYAPGEGFEFMLFDAVGSDEPSPLISQEEREELRFLAGQTNLWVTYDLESGMFALIDVYEWIEMRLHE